VATDKDFLAYIAEQAQLGASLSFKRLFGEYSVHLDGKVIAFACDNSLFVKATTATNDITQALPRRPPYPGAKPYPVADELLDDSDALQSLLLRTAQDLPAPTPRKPKPATGRHGIRQSSVKPSDPA
jgi:TfoX/Sxy family transcriptional regulator of competence genes